MIKASSGGLLLSGLGNLLQLKRNAELEKHQKSLREQVAALTEAVAAASKAREVAVQAAKEAGERLVQKAAELAAVRRELHAEAIARRAAEDRADAELARRRDVESEKASLRDRVLELEQELGELNKDVEADDGDEPEAAEDSNLNQENEDE
jgi:chromosome segregation ATPase